MSPVILAAVAALVQPAGPGVTPWNPAACKAELDSRFVHSVKPAGDSSSPIRRLSVEEAVRAPDLKEGAARPARDVKGGTAAAASPPCIILAPEPLAPGKALPLRPRSSHPDAQ